MLPISILRIWLTGLVSWAILVGGAYCIYEWYRGGETVAVQREVSANDGTVTQAAVPRHTRSERQALLAAGIGLIALVCFGRIPASALLGKPSGHEPQMPKPDLIKVLERPDGTRLHVQIFGASTLPTLVLTHGWSLDHTAWRYIIKHLGRRFRIIAWDLPGLGSSRGPRNHDYSLEKMASDLKAVIEESSEGPVILVGHSIGGMITQTFCRLYPEQLGQNVLGIALIHTTYTNPSRTVLFAPLVRAIETPILVPLQYVTIALAPLAWLSNWQSYWNGSMQISSRMSSFCGRQTRQQLNYSSYLAAKAWPAVVARGMLAMRHFDEDATLPHIDVPALVISARHDRLTKPIASDHIEQKLPRGAQTRIIGGHLGYWENNEEVAELLAEFVERLYPPGPAKREGLTSDNAVAVRPNMDADPSAT